MKYIKVLQRYAIYLFIFSINFETLDLLNLGIDYLATKITISLVLFLSVFNVFSLYSFKGFYKYFVPLISYFILLTALSYIYRSPKYSTFFDVAFFLNILMFIVLSNFSKKDNGYLLKGLLAFTMSTWILSIFYFLGLSISEPLEGRTVVFGINANQLGVYVCIAIFTTISIIFENKLKFGGWRYALGIFLPMLFVFMISTGSRTALLSFIIGLLILLFSNKSISSKQKAMASIVVFLIGILVWIFLLQGSLISERLTDSVKSGDLSDRDLIWVSVFGIITNNPIIGVGKTGYASIIEPIFYGVPSPHNVLIEVVCYTGVIGMIIFLIFLIRLIGRAVNKRTTNKEVLPLILLVPMLAVILSGQIFDNKIVWVIFAYIVSVNFNQKRKIKLRV